jgi:hypothetical protein
MIHGASDRLWEGSLLDLWELRVHSRKATTPEFAALSLEVPECLV